MIYKRKIYQRLVEWKSGNGRTALLIEGARRVGKSTIVQEFGRREYKTFILIDFNKTTVKIKNLFRNHLDDLDVFFQLLQVETGTRLYERQSLIIFDEVQKFPRAREAVKYLVEDGRFDYIETGSLISIRENVNDIVIPSEEEAAFMNPMDFEEFLLANQEEPLLEYIKECFERKMPLENELHRKAMLLLKQYMIVGGMPQSIEAYIENRKDFYAADTVKRNILKLYHDDIMKADRKYRMKVLGIYNHIPGFLSKHEKRVVLNEIASGGRYDGFADSFFWLDDSRIANVCYGSDDPNVGLALNEKNAQIKCYMGDTGLLISHTFTEKEIQEGELYRKILNDKLSVNRGMFFENLVAQMLTANGHNLFFYTHYNKDKHRNDIEIDFLLSNGSKMNFKVSPIEVKSSKNYSTVSLTEFKEKFKKRIAVPYVIHPKNYKEENGIIYMPIYMAFLL